MIGVTLRGLLLILLVTAAAFAARVAWHTLTLAPTVAEAPAGSLSALASGSQNPSKTLDAPPLAAFSETLSKPIFFEGRRIPERPAPPAIPPMAAVDPRSSGAPPPTATTPTTDIASLRLLGVMMINNDRRALIEADRQTGQWAVVGGKIGSWTIERIETDRVAIRSGRQSATLDLYSPQPATSPRTQR